MTIRVLVWEWKPNDQILSTRLSRIGEWKTTGSIGHYQLILYPTRAELIKRFGRSREGAVYCKVIRQNLMQKRMEAMRERSVSDFLEATRIKLEGPLLYWAESIVLTPMQLLESKLESKS